MENVNVSSIRSIVEIDKNARKKLEEAKIKSNEMIQQSEREKEELLNNYRERAENRLSTVEKNLKDEADERISKIEAEKNGKIALLDKKMEENKSRWKKEIIAEIIGE